MKQWLILLSIFFSLFVSAAASAQTMFDPTRPPKKMQAVDVEDGADAELQEDTATGIPKALVTAIYVTDSSRYAIINDDIVHEGETWKNVVVKTINLDNVVLAKNDIQKVVGLFNIDVAKETEYVY
ncbi:hypothetical protein KIH87_01580 [Paraneptunicella aestuarii]|uniref:hypothetical protein n=1 Tax=Paraneptunicella aestuarii TaxID=2831148 RepID=UPI001E64274B|nr:hypothetical protein [Paraneptunicella aestuarii]UAA39086.1 hypothetical protein KIH87_01580 [Paraneptunicella aestuarii]